jgi:hypothetical protein
LVQGVSPVRPKTKLWLRVAAVKLEEVWNLAMPASALAPESWALVLVKSTRWMVWATPETKLRRTSRFRGRGRTG